MDIVWLERARRDLVDLRRYIAQDDPRAAQRVARRILEMVSLLADTPRIGRPGRLIDTRELVVSGTPFIVIYRVKRGVIEILRVYHAARRWPSEL